MTQSHPTASHQHDWLSSLVLRFLDSKLSLILIVASVALGVAALWLTPREEDPQIVVPLADVYVNFPGRSAAEVEQLVSTPLEKLLYQIDGVEYVYSLSRENLAIVTVRFYVGQDRERSLVKLFKKINENLDIIPPGVAGWVVKPVEIDDVPVVALTFTGDDTYMLRRVAEEISHRLASIPEVSRTYVIGGEPRLIHVYLDPDRLEAHGLSPGEVHRALTASNIKLPSGQFSRNDIVFDVQAGYVVQRGEDLPNLVVGVAFGRPVYLKDVATVHDGPDETSNYTRHGWGPARNFASHHGSPGTVLAAAIGRETLQEQARADEPQDAVTIALAKKKGTNAVTLAKTVLQQTEQLRRHGVIPDNVEVIVTRNYGLTANEKVNELIEALLVAVLIVLALLTLSLGWRAALVVAIAIPVVFSLTLAVNLLCGYTINRVTLFALIVALGLLVDDPIVDVENIARHFAFRKAASHQIVVEAVAEIRPPLISATLAVIVSFLPLFFITGMMGPYMAPMALNVPVSMLMSMVVAFTITPWLSYHMLRPGKNGQLTHTSTAHSGAESMGAHGEAYDPEVVKRSLLYRMFRPVMEVLLASRFRATVFLLFVGGVTILSAVPPAIRSIPLKMLPYDNKNELVLVLDLNEGATLERTGAVVREFERFLARIPEVVDFVSYVGVPGPMDFNGLVRHYYLRQSPHLAEIRVNLVGKKNRRQQSHGIGLRIRDALTEIAKRHGATLKIVEIPPGPPVLASVVAEIYGTPDYRYEDLLAAADTVLARMTAEPGLVDLDSVRQAEQTKLVFQADQEKAALHGVSVSQIAEAINIGLGGTREQTVHTGEQRNPLRIVVRLPRPLRSSAHELSRLTVKGASGQLVPLAELGQWVVSRVEQTIYHKNLERVVYVLAETAGRTPAECIADVIADRTDFAKLASDGRAQPVGLGLLSNAQARPVAGRTFFSNGSGIAWALPEGIHVKFSGEGEWKITLDVFRDLGLAFGAAILMIYIILVAQTKSFLVPIVVMLAIPLTLVGMMPGFWLLNLATGQIVHGYSDPVYFTATAMIGMIALAGIVTRDSIILVDFIQQAVQRGRPLMDAILESRVVRLRPILLTAGAATLASIPITLDPIFSGLGWAIIFGLIASTVLTLFVIPVTYWLIYAGREDGTRVTVHGNE